MSEFQDLWVYLSATPLLHLTLTLCAFVAATSLYKKFGMHPLLNPVLLSIVVIVSILRISQTSYETYFQGAQFVHFLLGPATVALAVPLYRHFSKVRHSAPALLISLLCGSMTSAVTAVGIAWGLGAGPDSVISIASKSVTAPVAMGITEQLGGLPSLTAVIVILTGVVGAMVGPLVLNLLRIQDWSVRGFSIGTASHGIGTARAMQVNEVAGAFSGLAMGLNAIATAILLPIVWPFIWNFFLR